MKTYVLCSDKINEKQKQAAWLACFWAAAQGLEWAEFLPVSCVNECRAKKKNTGYWCQKRVEAHCSQTNKRGREWAVSSISTIHHLILYVNYFFFGETFRVCLIALQYFLTILQLSQHYFLTAFSLSWIDNFVFDFAVKISFYCLFLSPVALRFNNISHYGRAVNLIERKDRKFGKEIYLG